MNRDALREALFIEAMAKTILLRLREGGARGASQVDAAAIQSSVKRLLETLADRA